MLSGQCVPKSSDDGLLGIGCPTIAIQNGFLQLEYQCGKWSSPQGGKRLTQAIRDG
jgi:hypothetical protein